MDSPVHWAEPTAVRRVAHHVAARGRRPGPQGQALEPALAERVLLVTAYWRTNLTLGQLALLFGVSKSAADRIIDHLGPALAVRPRKRFRQDTVLIVDGTLVPTRDHTVAEQSKNYRYSANHQVVIDADPRLVVAVGLPLPGSHNDCRAWELSGAKDAVGTTTVIADGGYRGTGLGHSAPPRTRPDRTPGLETGTQCVPPQGPRPRRARLRPDEDLEDPSRLPSQGRRRPSRHARHRPFAEPRPHRIAPPCRGSRV